MKKSIKRPAMDIEVNLNNGEIRYTFPNASFSLLNRNQDDENTVDVITTLENHYDHKFLADHELEIVNDGTIYEAPLSDVLDTEKFYGYMEKTYGKWVK